MYCYDHRFDDLLESLRTPGVKYESHDLLFLEPTFHPGLNVTVRNGDKWARKTNAGDELLLKETGTDEIRHRAILLGKALVPFKLIPQVWLAHEHDPKCVTRKGLFEHGMKPAYPGFTEDNLVTVLLFWV